MKIKEKLCKSLWVQFLFLCVIGTLVYNASVYAEEAEEWMPDPALREAIRETLGIPAHLPLTPEHLQSLVKLDVTEKGVVDLTGLEHATSLRRLFADKNSIQDILPLTNLTSMEFLSLNENQISDITSLIGMQSLHTLKLGRNLIVDIMPLSSLRDLKHLELHYNKIRDFSPLAGLMNLETIFTWRNVSVDLSMIDTSKISNLNIDWECDIQQPSARERIQSRDYPSISAAWGNVAKIPTLSKAENIAHHDLYFCCPEDLNLYWRTTTQGLKLIGNFEGAKHKLNELRSLNPNLVILVPVHYFSGVPWDHEVRWQHSIPDDVFLRDESGDLESADEKLLDFTLSQTQQFVRDQVLALSKCGLFDGILFDHWNGGMRLGGKYPLEVEHQARDTILQGIREIVADDFLILVNAGQNKIPRWASYINGLYMETGPGNSPGDNVKSGYAPNGEYTTTDLNEIQDTLIWAEHALREPRINYLEAKLGRWTTQHVWEYPDQPSSPRNRRWMRFFTTMSLTLSDGYVDYENQPKHWYDFWDADLGHPVGEKGTLYENREGLFIREFTNGWAVYNRSGRQQHIQLPEKVSGVSSGIENKRWHTLPDLDGEIYLKVAVSVPADINGDGTVNILDLVRVANAFGDQAPDLNGDGTVNILDLVIVANAFE